MSVWRTTAVVLCSFRHKSPAGPGIDSDHKYDDHDNLPELEDIIQLDWLPVQPPPPPPQPIQSISVDEIFANFCSVLNLQLIPEDEQDTDAAAAACREAATEPSPEELISLLHRYLEAAATALAERMRRPHNLQQSSTIVGRQAHPFIGQFNTSDPPRPGDPRCGRCTSGQHLQLETTSPLPSPEPPSSPRSTPLPPPVLRPALAPIVGHQHQIRMLPVLLPPRPTAAAAAGRARAHSLAHARKPVSVSTTRYRHGMRTIQRPNHSSTRLTPLHTLDPARRPRPRSRQPAPTHAPALHPVPLLYISRLLPHPG
jgi:hypothetical protein